MPDFSLVALHTPRLWLRPLRPDDAQALFAIYSDPAFMRYWSTPPWTSIEQAHAMIERDQRELPAGEHLRLGITLRDSGTLIGTVSLFHLDAGCRRAEIGYGIAPAHWRQGYQREAVSAVITLAFGELALNRLEADIDPDNHASARALEALGFRLEGRLRERWIVDGRPSDSAIYGLLAADWPGQRSAPALLTAPPTLETDRLRLIPPSAACAEAWTRFYTDPVASHHYGGPISAAAAWTRLASDLGSWALQGFGVWALQRRDSGEIVGACGFWQGLGWPRELTWWLLPEARGQGLAAEASRAAIAHAHRVFGWPEVQTYMNDDNAEARALVRRLGAEPAGRQAFADGRERDLFRWPAPR